MLTLVVLSAGTAFASDDTSDIVAIDDGIVVDSPLEAVDDGTVIEDEALAVGEDSQILSANESKVTITPENINQYIDSSGGINENVTATEFEFEGSFENLSLIIDRPLIVSGGDVKFINPNFQIFSSNVTLQHITISQNKGINSIFVGGLEESPISDVTLFDIAVDFEDDGNDLEAIPIYVINTNNFNLYGAIIDYIGHTNGTSVNNVIRIENSKNATLEVIHIFAELVSASVKWAEDPAGSDNWVSSPVSEAVVVKNSDNVKFIDSQIEVNCSDVAGAYDTVYVVDFKNSNNTFVADNVINANGKGYIYGIILSGNDFEISENNITSIGDYYACGIDIEGPATGEINDNNIDVKATSSAYGIYSGMNGQDTNVSYDKNVIKGDAYNIFGMSLGDVESTVANSEIMLTGNYTTGIAYRGSNLNATKNHIVLTASEEGNESVWEAFGVEAVGIKVIKGEAFIEENTISTEGKGISLTGETKGYVAGNFINVVGNDDKDAYAIYAVDMSDLVVYGNNVDYQGTTNGTGINRAVYLKNITYAAAALNNFTLNLVSAPVVWVEEPAGSGNWVSTVISEGIVVEDIKDALFISNNVNVTLGDVVGAYDTIYAIDFKNTTDATISENVIDAKGNSYIYGIILSGDNFAIHANNITSAGDYYACGIDIEGPATGAIYDNNIDVKATSSAYGIYSGMNGQDTNVSYDKNVIKGEAYNVFGMSLGDVESNVTNSEIMLTGNYTTGIAYRGSNLNATKNHIVLTASEQGNESIWEAFGVEAVGIKVTKGEAFINENTISTEGKGISLTGETKGYVVGNFINVVGNDDKDAYAIYAVDISDFTLFANNVDYQGTTKGTGVNRAVYLKNTTGASVGFNNFTLNLVSAPVVWVEEPAGSGNWVSTVISEGIVVEDIDEVLFVLNNVNVTLGDVVGAYDTIYAVDFKNTDDALISDNVIDATGKSYIYGIILSGDNFVIERNNITSAGDYYACGIDIEGPATGAIYESNIDVKATSSAYGIYSGMNGQDTNVSYDNNVIKGEAYNVFGMSLGDVESTILNSEIMLDGNYTTGIAYRGSKITIDNTSILASGSNEGSEDIWEAFGVESIGIKIVNGTSTVTNNIVITTGNYPVDVRNTSASVHDNLLIGLKFIGDEGVANAENAEVYNNTPEIENKTAVLIDITEVNGNCEVSGILKDINGTPIDLYELSYTFDDVTKPIKTDENGTFKITGIDNGKLDIFLEEDSHYLAYAVSLTLKDIAPVKEPTTANVTIGDVEIGKDTNVTVDIPGATGNVSVIVDGVETIAQLDENGRAVVPIENVTGGEHNIVVIYTGDDTHAAAYKVETIFLEQFDTRFDNLTVEGSGSVDGVLVNALGAPIANATIVYISNGVESNVTTDENGWFIFNVSLDADLTISYAGTDTFLPTELSIKLQNMAPTRTATVIDAKDFTQYACDYYEYERGGNFTFRLLDEMGNPLANKTVFIGYNGVTLNRTTDADGYAAVQINLKNAGVYTFVLVFLGDNDYNASMAVHKITINKKKTAITASAKTFKATAKTKKYTVTLKTNKGSSVDGKTYLAKGKKLTLKINGVTYTAKTNAKGQATFSIKITKKGKFAASINFAGDNTYNKASKSVKITIK
ncbi:hypothetical protein [Methanobrevibacter sp.]